MGAPKGKPWSVERRAAYDARYGNAKAPMRRRCDRCYAEHDGTFGSGRFCCYACSRSAGGKANTKFGGNPFDWTGKTHSPQTLSKMKYARRLWWEAHPEAERVRDEQGRFS